MTSKTTSTEDVKKALDSADRNLHECFDMLMDFRTAQNSVERVILQFQPLLAETLFNLMELYNKLSSEKSILISEKDNYTQDEFSKKITQNGKSMKAIRAAIDIGKSLGDAFAWFFYRDNREELDKHFEHKKTGLYVSGIGGRGELEFIKKGLSIEGLYVLYHGITNMLRIGDFSLYDFNHGIVGLGELKTKREGDKLQISAVISSKVPINPLEHSKLGEDSLHKNVLHLKKDFPGIEKQLRAQVDALKTTTAEESATFESSYEYDMLNSLTPQNIFSLSSDKSLMIIAIWSQYRTFYEVLSERDEFQELPENALIESARKIIAPELPYNQFHMGELTTEASILSIPVLWWDIKKQICEDLYFKRLKIITIFNPAKLLNCFIEDGFSVTEIGELNKIKLQKKWTIKKYHLGIFHRFAL